MLSAARPNPPPPPERPGGAYELPPPVVSANSAKDNLTPFDFFFGSFTLAAAPSDGKDAFSACAGVGSSPSDGNAAAGGPRESNPSSFSSVCALQALAALPQAIVSRACVFGSYCGVVFTRCPHSWNLRRRHG